MPNAATDGRITLMEQEAGEAAAAVATITGAGEGLIATTPDRPEITTACNAKDAPMQIQNRR